MSDDTTQDAPGTGKDGNGSGNAPAAAGGSTPQGGSLSLDKLDEETRDYIKRLRDESAARRNRVKELEGEVQKLNDAGKSEEERKEQALKDAERDRDATAAQLLRFEVAADKGLPPKMAGRLQGSSKEELEKDADDLMKELGLDGNGGGAARGSGFDGGVRRGSAKQPETMTGLIRQLAGRPN